MNEYFKNTFWIDPRGKIHRYKGNDFDSIISMHWEIAHALRPNVEYPEDVLYNAGWIKVGGVRGLAILNAPTIRQMETLVELGVVQIFDDTGRVHLLQ